MGRKILVGMLLLGALLVFALGTFYIENLQYYFQALTGKKGYHLIARFETAQNLDEGDVVRLLGVEVGRVQDLSVEEGPVPKPVTAVLWIEEGVKVRADDLAYIETPGIFGGSYMAIGRGDPNAPVLHDSEEITNTRVQPTISQVIAKADTTLDDAGTCGRARSGRNATWKLSGAMTWSSGSVRPGRGRRTWRWRWRSPRW